MKRSSGRGRNLLIINIIELNKIVDYTATNLYISTVMNNHLLDPQDEMSQYAFQTPEEHAEYQEYLDEMAGLAYDAERINEDRLERRFDLQSAWEADELRMD